LYFQFFKPYISFHRQLLKRTSQRPEQGAKNQYTAGRQKICFYSSSLMPGTQGTSLQNKAVGYCPPANAESPGCPPQRLQKGMLPASEGAGIKAAE